MAPRKTENKLELAVMPHTEDQSQISFGKMIPRLSLKSKNNNGVGAMTSCFHFLNLTAVN